MTSDTTSSSTSPAQVTSGFMAYFPFNGNADDKSGNANNGIFYGAAPISDIFGNPKGYVNQFLPSYQYHLGIKDDA